MGLGNIAADDQQGAVFHRLLYQTGNGLHHAGTVGDQQYTGLADGLEVTAGSGSTNGFIVDDITLDAIGLVSLIQAVAQAHTAMATHAEHVLDVELGQALHQQVCTFVIIHMRTLQIRIRVLCHVGTGKISPGSGR